MAFDFPPDLIELQRAFFGLCDRCEQLAGALPSAQDMISGVAVGTPELAAAVATAQAALDQARAERLDVMDRLIDHPWWATVDDLLAAKQEIRVAARAET